MDIVYEYALIRYVPDIERGEFVNVGLIMMCKRLGWLHAAVDTDASRILCICPGADLERLQTQLPMFLKKDVPQPNLPVEETYRWLTAAKSAILQTSPSHPGIMVCPDNSPISKVREGESEEERRREEERGGEQERLSEIFDNLFLRLVK